MLLRVEEDEIIGRKCLDYGRSRGICVHVYLLLVLLGVLAQTRTNIAAEGDDISKKCVSRILGLADIGHATYFWQISRCPGERVVLLSALLATYC